MKHVIELIGLKREAILLDSRLYILKSMVAISIGYLLGQTFAITRLDMISVLLGVMYNLEANNATGFRSGVNQLLASTLGAFTTGILIVLAGYQINVLIIALGIGFTLYISLKIDYRMVSPVAIFTSIYMTQFLQRNELGEPSILSTFVLRIAALGLGIAVAMMTNYLFSILYYRQIGKRRLEFAKLQSVMGLQTALELLQKKDSKIDYQPIMAGVFSDVEMVKTNLETMMKENLSLFNRQEKANLVPLHGCVLSIKNIIHLAYDCVYYGSMYHADFTSDELVPLQQAITTLAQLDFTQLSDPDTWNLVESFPIVGSNDDPNEKIGNRLHQNMQLINDQLSLLKQHAAKVK